LDKSHREKLPHAVTPSPPNNSGNAIGALVSAVIDAEEMRLGCRRVRGAAAIPWHRP